MNRAERSRFAAIRLAAFDVDGVFTDGRFYLSDDGVETKAFSTLDGHGIRQLQAAGVTVAIISGRRSAAVEKRMSELGVTRLYLGCRDKVAAFEELLASLGLSAAECLYAGDDIPDLPLLERAGIAFTVANAHADVKAACDFITTAQGGFGAVREICDRLTDARRRSDERT